MNSDFLTSKRFNKSRSETIEFLNGIQTDDQNIKQQIEKVENEDTQILIKHRTYKRCKRQVIYSIVIIALTPLVGNIFPLLYLGFIIGFFVLISSIFGLRSNKVSELELTYISN